MDFGKKVYLSDDLQLIEGDGIVIAADFTQMIAFFESDTKEIVAKMQRRLDFEGRKFAPILPVIANRLAIIDSIPTMAGHHLWEKFTNLHNDYCGIFVYVFAGCHQSGVRPPDWRDFIDQ